MRYDDPSWFHCISTVVMYYRCTPPVLYVHTQTTPHINIIWSNHDFSVMLCCIQRRTAEAQKDILAVSWGGLAEHVFSLRCVCLWLKKVQCFRLLPLPRDYSEQGVRKAYYLELQTYVGSLICSRGNLNMTKYVTNLACACDDCTTHYDGLISRVILLALDHSRRWLQCPHLRTVLRIYSLNWSHLMKKQHNYYSSSMKTDELIALYLYLMKTNLKCEPSTNIKLI